MIFQRTARKLVGLSAIFLLISITLSCENTDATIVPEKQPEPEPEPERSIVTPLPLVTINTNGNQIVDEPKVNADMTLADSDGAVQYEGRIGIEVRGASSQALFNKRQYGLETRDAENEDLDASFLTFPEEEDWILHAPYSDKSLVRNHLIYNLAREMGQYASRSELVELNLNDSYDGLYVFMEKLKRDKNRIDISKLEPEEVSGEDLTGGYIIKIDKINSPNFVDEYTEQNSFTSNVPPVGAIAGQTIKFLYEYPDEDDIVPEQRTYISNYVADFETALASDTFTDPDTGYANYIDVDSFIDFFILNEFSNNVDAYRISTFLHKDKVGKLRAGPIWDFNIAFGNADYCEGGEPNVWAYKFNQRCPNDFYQVPFWWDRFLQDPAYVAQLKLRWDTLRGNTLANASVHGKIDGYVSQMEDALAARNNFQRWPVLGTYIWPNRFVGDSHEAEVEYLKSWIDDRLAWLDVVIGAM